MYGGQQKHPVHINDDDARYPPNSYGLSEGYGSSQCPKLPVQNASYSPNQYVDDEDEDEMVEEDDNDHVNEDISNIQMFKVEDNENDDGNEDGSDEDEEEDDKPNGYSKSIQEDEDDGLERHKKKRKLKSLLSSYEFAPRVPAPIIASASASKISPGGRGSLADWTEQETFVLLDAWGERFLKHGRKSLRSEEWKEVAEKVSQGSKLERTDTQCRNRLDTLKKKYKKEKSKLTESRGTTSKWVYFRKMEMLMSSSPQQSLSCGVDSGEFVLRKPKAYLNCVNGLDEMQSSLGNSESAERAENDSDGLPPKRSKMDRDKDDGASFRLLADSIEKFSEIYEKIENNKRRQLLELEKMRINFHRELELQKRQILERARAEIAKLRQGDSEDNDISA
ncbi:hypothetical protein NMG60_11002619 [Bertholletia excelsa]